MNAVKKNILIPVDGSQASDWALKVGAQLAAALSANVTILHVMIPPASGANEMTLMSDDLLDRLRAEGQAVLEDARRKLPLGITAQLTLREGSPAQEIIAHARQIEADFIVMGARGRGRWASFILGSNTESVIRWSPCPVISVSHDPSLPALPESFSTEPAEHMNHA